MIHKEVSPRDGRQSILRLSETGLETYRMLNSRSQKEIETMLGELTEHDQNRLVNAMRTIQKLLDPEKAVGEAYTLRPPQPGDLGWVVTQHGALYAREYGWDESFEGFVAEIIAEYVKNYIPEKERCWIAEVDGQKAGSVFMVRKSDEVAKLRMLIVTPEARGLGIGKRLVEECISFARQAGYRKMTLWTNNCLLAARHIYEHFGFRLSGFRSHTTTFGQDLVSETWELEL